MAMQMSEAGWTNPAIRRLCIAVGADQVGELIDTADQRWAPGGEGVLEDVRNSAALDRALWYCQPKGGGELALLPPGIDEGYIIAHFLHAAERALQRHNRDRGQDSFVRLRVAFHEGITELSDSGYSGPAVKLISGMLNAHEFCDFLTARPSAELAIIASQQVFEDVIMGSSDYMHASEFVQVQLANVNEGPVSAWIRVAHPTATAEISKPWIIRRVDSSGPA
jgi:hypothetical protein